MKQTVSARLDAAQLEALSRFGEATGQDRAALLREVIRRGLQEVRLEAAARAVAEGVRSMSDAACLAEVPVPDVMDEMARLGLTLPYGADDLEEDLRWATSSTPAS